MAEIRTQFFQLSTTDNSITAVVTFDKVNRGVMVWATCSQTTQSNPDKFKFFRYAGGLKTQCDDATQIFTSINANLHTDDGGSGSTAQVSISVNVSDQLYVYVQGENSVNYDWKVIVQDWVTG